MSFEEIDLSAFPPERERGLKDLYRYSRFDLMYYRSNLWMHSFRMLWVLEEIAEHVQKHLDIDIEKARILALVHDDAEIVSGDVQAGVRALMSAEELAAADRDEERGIAELAARFPKEVHGYTYADLLSSMIHKDTIEAQLVSYIDKFDAHNETLHEFFAGNFSILESVMLCHKNLSLIPIKFPALKNLLDDKTSPYLFTDNRIDREHVYAKDYVSLAPHTVESLKTKTNLPSYNAWKQLIIERGGEEGMRWLTEQREYNVVK